MRQSNEHRRYGNGRGWTRALFRVLMLISFASTASAQRQWYVSPNGDDMSPGLDPGRPLKSVAVALGKSGAGDVIRLLPGTYAGKIMIANVRGMPERPITIMSDAAATAQYAVIDGGSDPGLNLAANGMYITSSSWIVIKNLKFRNCWTDVIPIYNSEYVSVIGCDILGGRRGVSPMSGSHHILVENCRWEQHAGVWTTFIWDEMHHGTLAYYNGALLHPSGGAGSYVMRGNAIINVFNGFRSTPSGWHQDANVEIYNNTFKNVADNSFEPEYWAWNIHFYHNDLYNDHKSFSIDGVKGGPIYVYGNTHWQSKDANAINKVNGIWKFKTGPLTNPCYAFNNSFYTEAQAFKAGEGTNQQMKHYNNAYFFFQGSSRMGLTDWHSSFDFDNDLINQSWPANISLNNQEKNGLQSTDARFVDGAAGNFLLQTGSPAIDKGRIMAFPEFEWTQSFDGSAPDIGAYEGGRRVEGPPFRFRVPPSGTSVKEKPRIVRHRAEGDSLILYFSDAIDIATVSPSAIQLYLNQQRVGIITAGFPRNAFEMLIRADRPLSPHGLALRFDPLPRGSNGETATHWASTISIVHAEPVPVSVRLAPEDQGSTSLSVFPNPFNALAQIEYATSASGYVTLSLYDLLGRTLSVLVDRWHEKGTHRVTLDGSRYGSGSYVLRLEMQSGAKAERLVILK